MTQKLPARPWMTSAEAKAVFAALEAIGGAGCARFVGGCVRDALLGRDSPDVDVDIATTLAPDQTLQALQAAGIKAVPTGIDHGTVTAVASGRSFEITTLRRDVETDGRHAVVAYTQDWAEDAARRDFRLNALYADLDGTLHDPTGAGIADARAGRIIFVGDPATRIREDYLRILRFFRFTAAYGRGAPDAQALAACAALKDGLSTLSGERVSKELLKLLAAPDPREVARLMAATGILGLILPQAGALTPFEHLVAIESEMLFTCDALLRLAALLPGDGDMAREAARRLRLSNAQRDRIVAAVSGPDRGAAVRIVSWMSPREMRRAIWRLGADVFRDRVKLAWAASTRDVTAPQWRMLLVYPDTWTPPPFPISGDEILASGVPHGPLVGIVRSEIESWWLDLDFTDDKLAAIERLKAVAQGLAY